MQQASPTASFFQEILPDVVVRVDEAAAVLLAGLGWIRCLARTLLELVLVVQDLVLLVLGARVGDLLGQLGVVRIIELKVLVRPKNIGCRALARATNATRRRVAIAL